MFFKDSRVPAPARRAGQALVDLAEAASQGLVEWPEGMALARRNAEDAQRRMNLELGACGRWSGPARAFCAAGNRILSVLKDMENWGVPVDAALLRMSGRFRAAVAALLRALEAPSGHRQDYLIAAKESSRQLSTLFQEARRNSWDEPNMVSGLKAAEVYKHFSEAAGAVSEAAGSLAEILAESGYLSAVGASHGA